MKHTIYTKGPHPHIIVQLHCDMDRLIQNVKDEDVDPIEIIQSLAKGIELIKLAIHTGIAKRVEKE